MLLGTAAKPRSRLMRTTHFRLHTRPSALWMIFEVNFLRAFAMGMISPILPLFLKDFVHSDALVAAIYGAAFIFALISDYFASYIIEHLKKRKVFLISLFAITIIFLLFTQVRHTALVIFIFGLYLFTITLFFFVLSLYVKHYSNYREIAENEGKIGSLGNLAWVISPLVGTLLASKYGLPAPFYLAAFLMLISFFIFFFYRLESDHTDFEHRESFLQNIKTYFRNRNLRKAYFNTAGPSFIFATWELLPLLMTQIGANLAIIGITKMLMAIPATTLEYPIGMMASRETGEKKILVIGFFLTAAATLSLALFSHLPLFITLVFIGSVGFALVEMTQEAYFYRLMPEKEIELISVHRTALHLPVVLNQFIAFAVLSFVGIKIWYFIAGLLMFLFVLNALRLKKFEPKPAP